ncbi:glycoside hydrolase family 6 protein [Aeromicrobium yanjiei]|uniref:Glucanase n=1 Tax=Aeromicrobium yanjiei TaxID=2662028 RepID=A0A5Q2MP93_9ACTN|nr:glycoside hydrolase family 6 protein [Aeromicrobium yanjiei]QGG42375.1 hypothetical protein GEV26_13870 [Aeromicrobium yanjiei]
MSIRAAERSSPARRGLLLLVPFLIFVLVFGLARYASSVGVDSSAQESNPFADRTQFTWTGSAARQAAESASGSDRAVLERLAGVPTGIWLTPEAHPPGSVGEFVTGIVQAADEAGKVPVLVVYGITDRDCIDGESSGGLPPDQYEEWVEQIAEAAGTESVAILEPDALATAEECDQLDQRTELLGDAVDRLVDGGPTVYVDAGHGSWTDPGVMASMLSAVGVDKARGFSTNVSGYESDEDEAAYAEAVSSALTSPTHWVIDTSRNGAGSDGEWCNPAGRALGQEPDHVSAGGLDARLWIKPPGESDGTCGGGPGAGEFWTERALELARNAGW